MSWSNIWTNSYKNAPLCNLLGYKIYKHGSKLVKWNNLLTFKAGQLRLSTGSRRPACGAWRPAAFGASGINGLLGCLFSSISSSCSISIFSDLPWCGQAVKGYQKWVYDYRVAPREGKCAAPSALLLFCFPPKPELATVQWDNQIGDPN